MSDLATHIIVFHGTTSAFEVSIKENGFVPRPALRPSTQSEDAVDHMAAFDGTYVAASQDTARYYARMAAEHNGGEPRVYALRVPINSMVPDEDEVHFALSCQIPGSMGFDEEAPDWDTQFATCDWTIEAARYSVEGLKDSFGMDEEAVRIAAGHLFAMIEPTVRGWDGDLFFFHPEGNDKGWSSPEWVRKLTSMEGGLDLYRERMDLFLACMAGARPEDYPAGFESFKGRIIDPFGYEDNTNGVSIIGYGTPEDPFAFHANFDSFDGMELVLDPEGIEEARSRHNRAVLVG